MRRSASFALSLFVLLTPAIRAQSPAPGRISGNSYVNASLHISYTWPASLKGSLPTLPPDNSSHAYAYPLLTARQGDQPYGVVVVAEKLNVAGPHSAGLKTSGDLIDRIQRSLKPGPILANIARSQKKNAHGAVFDELDYTQSGKPASLIATQVGEYLIVFKCNAASAPEIAKMRDSAYALRTSK